jgi:glycosyltransferase involved in cell wall biosynthesis
MADAHLRSRLASAGREFVRANFSVEQMVRGNLKVYRALISTS